MSEGEWNYGQEPNHASRWANGEKCPTNCRVCYPVVQHFRIKVETRLVGGEFCEREHAAEWARRQVQGVWTIVECDQYGNELKTEHDRTIDSLKERLKHVTWHQGIHLDAFEVEALKRRLGLSS